MHPILYAIVYYILNFLHIDSVLLVRKSPQLLHAIPAAFTDVGVWKLSKRLFGPEVAR